MQANENPIIVSTAFSLVAAEKDQDGDDMRKMHSVTAKGDKDWAEIQHRTFVAWINHFLKERQMSVSNLRSDFSDGIKLINLVEVLTERKLGRYFKKVFNRIQALNNLDTLLKFLVKEENMTTISIGAADIVDGNFDMIMGLIWLLIQKYQNILSRAELLSWVRAMVGPDTPYEKTINNFTTDWNDGKLACALVDAIEPGAIPPETVGNDSEANARRALDIGAQLGIPAVVDAKDMTDPALDELSMLTYVSGMYAIHPDRPPPPPRAPGFDGGLYVEVVGPKSIINKAVGEGNERALTFQPEVWQSGNYAITIRWMGINIVENLVVGDDH